MIFKLTTKEHKEKELYDSDVYFAEFFNLLGVTAIPVSGDALPQSGKSILFCGEDDLSMYAPAIEKFAAAGGTVIALQSTGLESLCGVRRVGKISAGGEFVLNGHLVFAGQTHRLPVLAELYNCEPRGSEPLAYSPEYSVPLIFSRKVGKGRAIYFAFSLLKTLWYKNQGKPVYDDTDGDGYCRSGDSIIADPQDDFLLPSTDIYLHFIERLILDAGNYPFIHQIPADEDGEPLDYILYFAGDEDHCGEQMFEANRELQTRGVPYHVHLQPKDYRGFTIDRNDFDELRKQGLALSLHFDYITDETYRYDFAAVRKQVALYERTFGELPRISNTHWTIYNGFGETAEWYDALGLTGSFRQIGCRTDLTDINKMKQYGFAFGTSYPTRSVCGDKLSNCVDMKIVFYEPRIEADADCEQIDRFMRVADEYALMANIFIHPVYLAEAKDTVLPAVDRILRAANGKRVKCMYADDVAEWWKARMKNKLCETSAGVFEADFAVGCVLKFAPGTVCTVDGRQIKGYRKRIAGKDFVLVAIPEGKHEIRLK